MASACRPQRATSRIHLVSRLAGPESFASNTAKGAWIEAKGRESVRRFAELVISGSASGGASASKMGSLLPARWALAQLDS
jgi:hypothetical protein